MKVAEMIKRALEQKGIRTRKDAAKALDVSPELLRITLYQGHIPKDAILGKIADKLGLDSAELILAAHQEKVPVEVKGYFLSAAKRRAYPKKRVWPLSEEQCDHLGKVLNETEIQIIRMFRQIPDESKAQIVGYVDYTWATKRMTREMSEAEEKGKERSLKGEG
jgi:transposase-like protein